MISTTQLYDREHLKRVRSYTMEGNKEDQLGYDEEHPLGDMIGSAHGLHDESHTARRITWLGHIAMLDGHMTWPHCKDASHRHFQRWRTICSAFPSLMHSCGNCSDSVTLRTLARSCDTYK